MVKSFGHLQLHLHLMRTCPAFGADHAPPYSNLQRCPNQNTTPLPASNCRVNNWLYPSFRICSTEASVNIKLAPSVPSHHSMQGVRLLQRGSLHCRPLLLHQASARGRLGAPRHHQQLRCMAAAGNGQDKSWGDILSSAVELGRYSVLHKALSVPLHGASHARHAKSRHCLLGGSCRVCDAIAVLWSARRASH